jgi:AAA domain
VRLLREKLPAGVEVGTVDKFQGREAAVVFYSMASSSGEDVPRGLEFLLSRNRLNVAISRAKCLAYLVCSPRLLEVTCRRSSRCGSRTSSVDSSSWPRTSNTGTPPLERLTVQG